MPSFLKRHDNKQSFPVRGSKPSIKDYSAAKAENASRQLVRSYRDADALGMSYRPPTNVIIDKKTKKIIGYIQGTTFSRESLRQIDPRMKLYRLWIESGDVVTDDSLYEEPFNVEIHAINDTVAKEIASAHYHKPWQLFAEKLTTREVR